MFGMVAATGIKILGLVDFFANRRNIYIVAVSVALAIIPVVAPTMFDKMPDLVAKILHGGILVGTLSALALSLLFNGVPPRDAGPLH